jgi:hypothetical protein
MLANHEHRFLGGEFEFVTLQLVGGWDTQAIAESVHQMGKTRQIRVHCFIPLGNIDHFRAF